MFLSNPPTLSESRGRHPTFGAGLGPKIYHRPLDSRPQALYFGGLRNCVFFFFVITIKAPRMIEFERVVLLWF